MAFYKTAGFKYLKNFVIGVGASIVMLGALYKIMSWEGGDIMITAGLITEAILFFILGVLPPDKDYYWEKLYPGLDKYTANLTPLTDGPSEGSNRPLNAHEVEGNLNGMLSELQAMSKSLGSLKALQEVDFSQTKDQMASMGNFYSRMNEAMSGLSESLEDTKQYQESLSSLNRNLSSLNSVYGNILSAHKGNSNV